MQPVYRLTSDYGCKVFDGNKPPSLAELIRRADEVIFPNFNYRAVPLTKEEMLAFEKLKTQDEEKTAVL